MGTLATPATSSRRYLALWLAVASVEAALYFCSAWVTSGGHFMLPLDDAYIHLQYARMLAAGSPLVYSPGSLPSGGATSPLWVALLSPAFLLGLRGAAGAMVAFLAGIPLLALSATLLQSLVRRLAGPVAGTGAAALLLLNGHACWGFFSGMETGLFITLLLAGLHGMTAWRGEEADAGMRRGLLAFALLPLVRPEGILVNMALGLFCLLPRDRHARRDALLVLATALPFALWSVFLLVRTGSWQPSGAQIKGILGDPEMTGMDRLALATRTMAGIFSEYFQNRIPDPAYAAFRHDTVMPYLPLGAGFLAFLGAGWCLVGDARSRQARGGSLLALAWGAGMLTLAASRLPFIHHQRYMIPWDVLTIALATVCLRRLAECLGSREELATRAGLLALVLASLPAAAWWIVEYGRNSRDIYSQHRQLTFSLERAAPGTRLALSDAGVLEYYTQLPHIDVMGLTTSSMVRPCREGEGAVLDTLADLPVGARPTMFATYDDWWGSGFPRGRLVASRPLRDVSIAGGGELVLRDWPAKRISQARRPFRGGRILEEINVADPASEAASGYRFEREMEDRRPGQWPPPNCPVLSFASDVETTGTRIPDGGRFVRAEEFDVVGLSSATSPTLVLRIAPSGPGTEPQRPLPRRLAVFAVPRTTQVVQEMMIDLVDCSHWIEARVPLRPLLGQGRGPMRLRVEGVSPVGGGWYSHHIFVVDGP